MKPKQQFELNLDSLKAVLPVLQKIQPLLFGAALVGVFGFTAYAINNSLNVKAAETQTTIKALPKITFDKPTIKSLDERNKVDGNVPLDLGTSDPF
jgi:hypothetical protein